MLALTPAAGGGLGRQRHPAAASAHVRSRPPRTGLDAFQAVAGVVHAQWLEDAARHRLAVELAGGGEHDVADQAERHVLVGVAVARRAGHRRVGHAQGQVVVVRIAFQVAVERVVGQAHAVAQDVRNGDPLCRVGHRHPERGHVVGEPAVPAQHAVVDQDPGHGAGEGLRQRGQAEHRVGVHRLRCAGVGDAVTTRAEDAAILDDRHRQAGNAAIGDERFGNRLEACDVETGGRGRQRQGRRQVRRHGGGCAGDGTAGRYTALGGGTGRQRQQGRDQTGFPDMCPGALFHRLCPLRMLRRRVDSSACFRDCMNKGSFNG